MEQLLITEKSGPNYKIYELSGSLNSYTLGEFRDKGFAAIQENNVILDLSNVEFVDSAGIGIIMALHNDGEDFKHGFYIMNPSAAIRTAIEDTGFFDLFKFVHSVRELD